MVNGEWKMVDGGEIRTGQLAQSAEGLVFCIEDLEIQKWLSFLIYSLI